jgi:ribonuclease Z
MDLTRKEFLAASGATAGALWAGNALGIPGVGGPEAAAAAGAVSADPTQQELARRLIQNSWYLPVEDLAADEMRISFMGSSFTPRVNQAMNSVFIEVGTGQSFVFDCGSGVITKYTAMGIPSSRMTRVFITHLHGDHMSDLVALYCFGPAHDRKTPLHIYGPSGPVLQGRVFNDQGTKAFCKNLQALCKWHTEAFSFLSTGLTNGEDGYQVVPHELPYKTVGGEAYRDGDVLITHFPVAHDRDGSIGYKLEWNGMKVVFSGDTKPVQWILDEGRGVDVLIHEMALSPNVWVEHQAGLYPGDPNYQAALAMMQEVQDNSHTPEEALGEILAATRPRLGVITHCHFNQDTFIRALDLVRKHYDGPLAWATDTVVLNLRPGEPIKQRMALISPVAWDLGTKSYDNPAPPKYDGPYAQFSDFTMNGILPGYKG